MSRQYEVPLTDIYPASPSQPNPIGSPRPDETSSDESSDVFSYDEQNGDEQQSDLAEEGEDEENSEADEPPLPVAPPSAPSIPSSGRPQRQRQPPQWMRTGTYDLT